MAIHIAEGTTMSASAHIVLNGGTIQGSGSPANGTDLATKGYVDSQIQGLEVKGSVRAATVANITLSGTQSIDNVSIIADDRVLVKDQTTASQNGIYVAASGAWSRAVDMASGSSASGAFCFVEEGDTNADMGFACSNATGSDVVGTDSLTWVQFSGTGQVIAGNGLTKTGNTIDVGVGNGISVAANSVALNVQENSGLIADVDGFYIDSGFGGEGIDFTAGVLSLESLTQNWDAGSYKITAQTFQSDVPTGTAPLTIASTTKVTNLNADSVDGKGEAVFALLAGRSGGQVLIGGTGSGDDLELQSTSNSTKGDVGTAEDFKFTSSSVGPVLKDSSGTYWRMSIDTEGVVTTTSL